MPGPDLQRFVDAQDASDTYDAALGELRRGRKTSHWMWFVFPQVAGLGLSPTARHFALPDLSAARSYLDHPVLGPRLLECSGVLAGLDETDPVRVLGPVDAMKLRSSMTLFAHARPEEPVFATVLAQFFGGREDEGTTSRL